MGFREVVKRIWVPKSARPRYECFCGAVFTEDEELAWLRHVPQCASNSHDELVAQYEQARPPGFYRSPDPEYRDWVREHGHW